MNQRGHLIRTLLLALCLLGTADTALPATGALSPPERSEAVTVRDEVSLSEAVARVKREYGGRILEAETQEKNGRRVHVIKVLTREGRVRTVRIPAGGDR